MRAGAGARACLESWDFDGALDSVWALVKRANQYVDENQPWKLARDEAQVARLDTVLYGTAEALRNLSIWLTPFMPSACATMQEQLGLPPCVPVLGQIAWSGAHFPPK